MKSNTLLKTQACLLLLSLCLAFPVRSHGQGSLTPDGAPAPVMKTLGQIEPRIDVSTVPGGPYALHEITNSGSYYLTTNILFASKDAIRIRASNVVLDLNGFTISGGTGTARAVWAGPGVKGIKVRNGVITGFNGNGIDCEQCSESVFEDLQISYCLGSYGIGLIVGPNCEVSRVRSANNKDQGFRAGDSTRFFQCTAISNGMFGFSLLERVVAKECVAISNYNAGFKFWLEGGRAESCLATYNGGAGFDGVSIDILNSRAERNGDSGVIVNVGGNVNGCVSVMNRSAGISVVGATVMGCTTVSNGTDGISVYTGGIVRQSTSKMNKRHGIYAVESVVSGNVCTMNGTATSPAAGIMANTGNRVEGNTLVANNPDGLSTSGNNNLAIQNSARANTNNFQIGYGSTFGPIVSGIGVITNSNPWANFSY